MTIDELEALCREAGRDVLAKHGRPVSPAVVVPLASATRIVTLDAFPELDEQREQVLAGLASEVMRPAQAPAYGFLAEADVDGVEVLMVVFGARGHHPKVSAAPLEADRLGDWLPSEELDPRAMPFIAPLQRAADEAPPPA